MISKQQLSEIVIHAGVCKIETFFQPLIRTMEKYEINSRLRIAAFIAQIAHESGSFNYVQEIASGKAYEGRKSLGNTQKGDGVKYKGRGLIQITGRVNYTAIAKDLNLDCVNHPLILELPEYAALSAGWFWSKKGLNSLADNGDFIGITKKINGGINGLEDRQGIYKRALQILK